MIKLNESEIVKGQKMEYISITLMNRDLDPCVTPKDPNESEIVKGCSITHWSTQELLAIQSTAKEYLVGLMHDGMLATIHAKHVTITDKDPCVVCRF